MRKENNPNAAKRKKTPSFKEVVTLLAGKRKDRSFVRKTRMKEQMMKAGISLSPAKVEFNLSVLSFLITAFGLSYFFKNVPSMSASVSSIALWLIFIFLAGFNVLQFVVRLFFFLALDIVIFQRKQKVEAVLPDFLQLASSNVRAGMTVDRALWFAVRARFGVLSKDIEEVAKKTFSGEPLDQALEQFAKKYDSDVLQRSINLLIEGLRAGGEMGSLMNKIATNIQESNLLRREMSASVTTYVIFISFATVLAAPFLFGMAFQLIIVIQKVFSKVDLGPGTSSSFSFDVSNQVISTSDFQIFAVVSLLVTSFFSSIIISTIKRGNIKAGVKYIPAFMISSVILFFLIVKGFGSFVGGMF